MKRNSIVCIILICILCNACWQKETFILDTAWESVERDPQQVISLLDTCSFSLPAHRAQRAWLLSRAYDKCDINLTSDTLIMRAVKYYKRTHNQAMYLRSLYCLGRVHLNAGDSYNAMMSFEQAADMARERDDWFWLGLSVRNLADIYAKDYLTEKSVRCEEEAVRSFMNSGDSLYLAYERLALARAYHFNGNDTQCDSLLSFLLVQSYQDSMLVAEIHKTKARTLIERKYPQFEEAFNHYQLSCDSVLDMHDYCNIYLALASMGRAQEPQALSLQKQIEALADSPDDNNRAQANYAIYSYSKRIGDYKASLLTFEKIVEYQDSLFMKKIQQSILANQKEHYKMQSIQERDLRQMITVISVLGTLLLFSAILLLLQRTRQKRKQAEVAMSQIEEIQRKYDRLSQDTLQKEIDTLSQLAEEYYESGNKRQQQSIIAHFYRKLEAFRDFNSELTFLEKDINTYRDQAMEHFRAEFPGLSKHTYKMAVVFFAGLPNSLIGLLMNKTTPTIRTERSLLRKKISDSTAPHKADYLKLLDNYQRENRVRTH